MDILDGELISFWKTLNEKKVLSIMIGGFATRFHGFNRSTDDLDRWLKDDLENRKKLRKVFDQWGYGDLAPLETMPFAPGFSMFRLGSGVQLDILTEMEGLEKYSFQECLNLASLGRFGDIEAPFLHINHLIENKKNLNRPKDQVDVIELEKIRKIREQKK
jgi:hypothetical protein